MDTILKTLQGRSFHLSQRAYDFLAGRYEDLVNRPIPDLQVATMDPGLIRRTIGLHREQFHTPAYVESRINNPATGTIDHLHAEITAATAARLATAAGYEGYAVELVRTAGHLHDSDRAFPDRMIMGEESTRHDAKAYDEHKKAHALNSWKRAEELLTRANEPGHGSPVAFASDLRYLILRHELGGEKVNGDNIHTPSAVDPDLNLNTLTDIVTGADSLAYFDANILTNWEECGKNKVLLGNKVHFMYDRMPAATQGELRNTIVFCEDHILGSATTDPDLETIRSVLLQVCG